MKKQILIILILFSTSFAGKYFVAYMAEDSAGAQRINSLIGTFVIDSTLFDRLRKRLSDGNIKCKTILNIVPLDRDTIYIHDTVRVK